MYGEVLSDGKINAAAERREGAMEAKGVFGQGGTGTSSSVSMCARMRTHMLTCVWVPAIPACVLCAPWSLSQARGSSV